MSSLAFVLLASMITAQSATQPDSRQPTRFPELGLRLAEPTPELLQRYGLDPKAEGVLVRGVDPNGRADEGGFEIGMLITDAAGRKVKNLAEFRAATAHQKPETDLIVRILKKQKAEFRVLIHH